jgi:hypothetical protein
MGSARTMLANNENDENSFPLRPHAGLDGVSESLHCPFLIVLAHVFMLCSVHLLMQIKLTMKQSPLRMYMADIMFSLINQAKVSAE